MNLPATLEIARFGKSLKTTVTELCQIVRNCNPLNPLAQPPTKESKLLACLEFVIVKMFCCGYRYELIDDGGWPVPKIYDGLPRTYNFLGHDFEVTILQDLKTLYILIKCDPFAFRLVECITAAVPDFINVDLDMNRYIIMQGSLHEYLKKFKQDRPVPKVTKFERDFLSMRILTATELAGFNNVLKCPAYELMTNVNSDLNSLNRLYRTVIYLLHCNNCTSPGNEEDWAINLIDDYQEELIYDVEKTYLYGFRIPENTIMTFRNDDVFNDNTRIQETNKFLFSVLTKSLEPNRLLLRTTSTSDSSIGEGAAAVAEANFIVIN